jgi:Glycosyltransferases involved in cell wall biogenesis
MNTISVIVPVYYGEKYMPNMIHQVEACRKYLGAEDYVEVLFVNDAPDAPLSQDWSAESIQIVVMNTDRNTGIQGARLKGLQNCQGEYVLFLDQDDLIRPEYFCSQLSAIGEHDAVICKAIHANEEWYKDDYIFENVVSKEFMLGMQWGLNPIASPGQVLLRKSAIPDVWKERMLLNRGADDWLLWLYMISEKCSFARNSNILYEHVVHKGNFSNHMVEMLHSEQEVVRIFETEEIFSESDKALLLDGFFKRNIIRAREHSSLKTKWSILETWAELKENHVRFSENLKREGMQSAAIYGCAILGRALYDELKQEIEVKYFIDKNVNAYRTEIPIYSLQDELPEADVIIVTLIDEAEEVKERLTGISQAKVLVLKDWILTLSP